jgi:hypothetical protein
MNKVSRRHRELRLILEAVGAPETNLDPLLRALRRAKYADTCLNIDASFIALNTIRRLLRPEGTP